MAYACQPHHGSESAVGWNRALQAAQHFDTWVICEANWCQEPVERYLAEQGPPSGLKFVFVPKSRFERMITRAPGLFYVAYNLWQRRAMRVARTLHQQEAFDLVHQATYCGYREPGYTWQLDAPFVWGPVGGAQNVPWRFLPAIGLTGAASEALRSMVNHLQLRFHPRVRRAARSAALVLAANTTNRDAFARTHRVEPQVLLEIGLTNVADAPAPVSAEGEPLRILWVGECRPFKALPILLRALAQLPGSIPYQLQVLGDGPARRSWERLARRLGIADHLQWFGKVPYDDVLKHYQHADLFAFTSLRDTTGSVVLEALSAGVPVLCFDHQGVRDLIDSTCGIKLPVTTPAEAVISYRDTIAELARDRTRLARLGAGALIRARRYLWSAQGARMAAHYHEVLAHATSPSVINAATPSPVAAPATADQRRMAWRWLVHENVREYLKDFSKNAAGKTSVGFYRVLGHRDEQQLGILVYHRVHPPVPGVPRPTMNVTPQQFEKQIVGLLRRGYQVWPLQQVLQARAAGRSLPPKVVVITFDDAFGSVYQYAWPIMQKLGVPSTVFISTAYLDREAPFPFDPWGCQNRDELPAVAYRPLTTAQCHAMTASRLVEIAPHTHTHEDFRGRPQAFQRDLQQSIDIVREVFHQQDVSFAFPYGRISFGFVSPALLDAARQTGVCCALTTEAEPVDLASDPFGWPRFNAYEFDTGATLAAKISGWYSWAPRLQERLRRTPSTAH